MNTDKLFAVRDVKSDSFGSVIVCPTQGIAMRTFSEACKSEGPMAKYPADFSLYELGEYDSRSGKVTGHDLPVYVCSAAEMVMGKPAAVPVGEIA